MSTAVNAALDRTHSIGQGVVAALPNVVLALVVFGLFWLAARGLGRLLSEVLTRTGQSSNAAHALSRVLRGLVLVIGVLVAATIIFPTLNAATLFSTLGFSGVAIGFAFKDIFQNLLAGLLILITRPFHIGDQIISGDTEGTVEDIQIRATIVRTYDNRRVVLPNSDLYTGRVTVNTAFDQRRVSIPLTLPYGGDLGQVRQVIVGAARGVDGVGQDPPPSVVVTDLTMDGVAANLWYWVAPPKRREVAVTTDAVLTAVNAALQNAKVNLSITQGVTLDPVQLRPAEVRLVTGQEGPAAPGEPAP